MRLSPESSHKKMHKTYAKIDYSLLSKEFEKEVANKSGRGLFLIDIFRHFLELITNTPSY